MKRLIQRILRFFGFVKSEPVLKIQDFHPKQETEGEPKAYPPKRRKAGSHRKSHKGKKYEVYAVKFKPFVDMELIPHKESDLLSKELNILAVSKKYPSLKKSTMYAHFSDESNSNVYRLMEYRVVECD